MWGQTLVCDLDVWKMRYGGWKALTHSNGTLDGMSNKEMKVTVAHSRGEGIPKCLQTNND